MAITVGGNLGYDALIARIMENISRSNQRAANQLTNAEMQRRAQLQRGIWSGAQIGNRIYQAEAQRDWRRRMMEEQERLQYLRMLEQQNRADTRAELQRDLSRDLAAETTTRATTLQDARLRQGALQHGERMRLQEEQNRALNTLARDRLGLQRENFNLRKTLGEGGLELQREGLELRRQNYAANRYERLSQQAADASWKANTLLGNLMQQVDSGKARLTWTDHERETVSALRDTMGKLREEIITKQMTPEEAEENNRRILQLSSQMNDMLSSLSIVYFDDAEDVERSINEGVYTDRQGNQWSLEDGKRKLHSRGTKTQEVQKRRDTAIRMTDTWLKRQVEMVETDSGTKEMPVDISRDEYMQQVNYNLAELSAAEGDIESAEMYYRLAESRQEAVDRARRGRKAKRQEREIKDPMGREITTGQTPAEPYAAISWVPDPETGEVIATFAGQPIDGWAYDSRAGGVRKFTNGRPADFVDMGAP